ncbi:MAG: hypothetical protein HYV03_01685, partial [Deltaproteobacteria bacterium]|nr:hypothetical protein [Deltaproteobacteria bacterium]
DGVCADAAGECTLRAAITESNATPEADTIYVPAGTYPITIVGNDDDNFVGDFDILSDLMLFGDGPETIIDAKWLDRVFQVGPAGKALPPLTVTIAGMTIRNGAIPLEEGFGEFSQGGCLHSTDTDLLLSDVVAEECTANLGGAIHLTASGFFDTGYTWLLEQVRVRWSVAGDQGGGVSAFNGIFHANECQFSDNMSIGVNGDGLGVGGGLALFFVLSNIANSEFSRNRAGFGGGVYNAHGPTTLTNDTFSSNTAQYLCGGGFCQVGDVAKVSFSTFVRNQVWRDPLPPESAVAKYGMTSASGGIDNWPYGDQYGEMNLKGVLLSLNGDAAGIAPNCHGPVTSVGGNVIQDPAGCDLAGEGVISGIFPDIGKLQENGGFTPTHPLYKGSVAINIVPPDPSGICTDIDGNAVLTDQRGFPRPNKPLASCDAGAFERQRGEK